MKKRTTPTKRFDGGFTLIELLVVIAIIAILAALLLPTLARAKEQGNQTKCRNNLKQLNLGMAMYLNDARDVYPSDASRTSYGFQPEDWIYWRTGADVDIYNGVLETIDKSPVVMNLGTKATTNLFRCPDDINDSCRLNGTYEGDPVYYYSYSMLGNGVNGINYGLTSVQENESTTAANWFPFKNSQVLHPSRILNFAEEDTLPIPGGDSPADYPVNGVGTSASLIDDGRFVPYGGPPLGAGGGNFLTMRHDQSGPTGFANISYVDGHVALGTWKIGTNALNNNPTL